MTGQRRYSVGAVALGLRHGAHERMTVDWQRVKNWLRNTGLRVLVFALLSAPAVVSAAADPSTTSFIKTSGTNFTLDGRPFFVTGVNNHYLPFGTEAEVTRVLDDAVALGANVVRTFLTPIIGSPDDDRTTIWNWHAVGDTSDHLNVHGNYLLYWDSKKNGMGINEGPNGMQRIDWLVAAAKERHLRLIITFLDFWDFTGGIQQMSSWYGVSSNNYFVAVPNMRDDHFFFTDPRTIQDFRHWVEYVVNRMNPRTGRHYRDDPTIMAWELANEANAQPNDLRLKWTAEMAAYVKQQDPNHLVASGNANIDPTTFDIALPAIDFGTWHAYPKYLEIGVDQFDRMIRQYCDIAVRYQKPVLLEEFGWARSNPGQVEAYAKWLNTISENPNCAGWLVWRLVSLQQGGTYPLDGHPNAQFDVRRDEIALWNLLHEATTRGRVKPH
jgi:mannan endo-1,4-beta-mannosidase